MTDKGIEALKDQWRQDQTEAHKGASQAALQAARQVDPKADMVPRPYYVEGFGFRGTMDAARVYFDTYDSCFANSMNRHKNQRCLALRLQASKEELSDV